MGKKTSKIEKVLTHIIAGHRVNEVAQYSGCSKTYARTATLIYKKIFEMNDPGEAMTALFFQKQNYDKKIKDLEDHIKYLKNQRAIELGELKRVIEIYQKQPLGKEECE